MSHNQVKLIFSLVLLISTILVMSLMITQEKKAKIKKRKPSLTDRRQGDVLT